MVYMINKYLKDHSLKEKFVKSLGWAWKNGAITIAVPIYDEKGKLLFSRYRHLEGKSKFSSDKGAHPALYCVHKIKRESHIIFCEGEPDCARLWQEGISAVTGTSGVKTFSKALARPLAGKVVKICLDNDEAGKSSVEQYYNILKEAGAEPKIKQLPKQFKDISNYFTAGHTKKDFSKLPTFKTIEEWKDSNLPEEFKTITADDILATELPKEKWLVDKIIPVEGFCFFVGPEASAKSFHSLLLARCVTTGEAWLKTFNVKKQTKVLIIDKENTMRRIQDRLRGLKVRGNNIYWLAYPQYLEIADQNKESESGYTAFIESISRLVKREGIGLIILDSFTDIFVGEENNRGDVQKFFDAFRQLFPGIAILPIHHAGKITMGVKRPTSQMARGSTNIMAQAYTAFHCEPVRRSTTEFTVEQTKAGDSLKMKKFKVEIQTIIDPSDPGETLVTGFKYLGEVQDKEEKLAAAIEVFEEAMAVTPRIARKELAEQLEAEGISPATFGRVIKQLKEDGKIRMEKSQTIARGSDIVWMEKAINVVYE